MKVSSETNERHNGQKQGLELNATQLAVADDYGIAAPSAVEGTDTPSDTSELTENSTDGTTDDATSAIQNLLNSIYDITGLDINRDMIPVLHNGWIQGMRPVRTLLTSGLLTPKIADELLVQRIGFIAVEPMSITSEAANKLPQWFCEQHSVIPVHFDGEQLTVASEKNLRILIKNELEELVGCKVAYRLTSTEALMACLATLPGRRSLSDESSTSAANQLLDEAKNQSIENWETLIQTDDGDRLISQHIEALLARAIAIDASDVHIQTELTEKGSSVVTANLRRLGDLVAHDIYSIEDGYKLINRLKVAGGFDVDPTKPCDGRYDITIPGSGRYDLRLAGMPLSHGQMLVVRLLPQMRKDKRSLEELFPVEHSDLAERIQKISQQPEGILLVVGSTGSGKSTTLAATIRPLAENQAIKVVTVEDPVENLIRGAQQVAVTPRLGFGDALRGFLRSDPDVILLGEIRDQDTAGMAIRAAQTGHIVFSTLHASSVEIAPGRLSEMGVPATSLADVLLGILSQRLIKTLCKLCSSAMPHLNRTPKPRGCDSCAQTGWGGRMAIAELLEVNSEVVGLIANGAPARKIREAAQIVSYSQFAAKLIDSGLTTREEVVSKLGETYDPSFETSAGSNNDYNQLENHYT